jgi:hypothetical protein
MRCDVIIAAAEHMEIGKKGNAREACCRIARLLAFGSFSGVWQSSGQCCQITRLLGVNPKTDIESQPL